jgi:hypothetical protein
MTLLNTRGLRVYTFCCITTVAQFVFTVSQANRLLCTRRRSRGGTDSTKRMTPPSERSNSSRSCLEHERYTTMEACIEVGITNGFPDPDPRSESVKLIVVI